jgi:flagellin-like protein
MSGKKGISPMIATVLLIAFTVAVGGIISMWLTTMASTQTTATGTAAEKQVLCARSVLSIDEVTSHLNTTAGGDTFNVTVTYMSGSEDLYYFNISLIDNLRNSFTATPVNVTNFNKTNPFKPGSTQVFNLNIADRNSVEKVGDLLGSSLYSLKVIAKCQDNYPITGECKAGQGCME